MRLLTISIRVAMINNLFSFCFLGLAKCIGKKDSAKFQVDAVEAVASLGEEKAKEKTWPLSVRRRRTRAKKKTKKKRRKCGALEVSRRTSLHPSSRGRRRRPPPPPPPASPPLHTDLWATRRKPTLSIGPTWATAHPPGSWRGRGPPGGMTRCAAVS